MNRISSLKGTGYLTSAVSVALLGAVSWKSASHDPVLFACLLGGMASSVAGMGLRWCSHRTEKKQEEKQRSTSRGVR